MDPIRKTAPELLEIQAELVRREPIFHRPEHGTSRQAFELMTADEFWETGASGRRYSRAFVIDTVVKRYSGPYDDQWKTEDFYCQKICSDHYLLTYTLRQGAHVTRRATLWRKMEGQWLAVYHQGTLAEEYEQGTAG